MNAWYLPIKPNLLMVHMHGHTINISATSLYLRSARYHNIIERHQFIELMHYKPSTLARLVISMHTCLCAVFPPRCFSAELQGGGEADLRNVCQTVSSCNRLSHPSSLFIQAETSGTAGCLSFVSVGVRVSNNYVYVDV